MIMGEPVGDDFNEDSDDEKPLYTGRFDTSGEYHGRGTLKFSTGDEFHGHFFHGCKQGRGTFYFADGSSLSGYHKDDCLEGRGIYQYEDGGWMDGVYSDGELNGPACEFTSDGTVVFKGNYRDNIRTGCCWIYRQDGGCIVGHVDHYGAMTGINIAYIYPDNHHVLVGKFKDGEIVKVRSATVSPNPRNGTPKFTLDMTAVTYHRDVSTQTVISQQPLLRDCYESSRVYVKTSLIPGANEGLFSRIDEKAGCVMSFYNGIRLSHSEVDERDWLENSNTISLDSETVIDVPQQYISTEVYCASLGHKANHSFTPNCKYDVFEHPRFGPIKCIRTIQAVRKDEELTVFYGYDHQGSADGDTAAPEWYLVQMKEHHQSIKGKS